MNMFKSWRVSSSASKAQKMWSEFKQVSHLKDDPETLIKLKKFLDYVQKALKEFMEKNQTSNKQIDEIVGESSDILKNLLQFLSEYQNGGTKSLNSTNNSSNEIINQILEIAEMILRDPKYRKQIENSPSILSNFLNMADKLESSESKVTVVKLIIMIAENVDSKISFAQNEGFAKLMKLLMDKDERVSRIISRALLHFLQIDNTEESRIINEIQGQINEKEEFVSIKTKIKKIALDFRKFTFSEIQRIFLQNDNGTITENNKERQIKSPQTEVSQDKSQSQAVGPINSQNGNLNASAGIQDISQFEVAPNYEEVFETDLRMLIALQINKESNIIDQQVAHNQNTQFHEGIDASIISEKGAIKNNVPNLQLQRVPSCPGILTDDELEESKFHSCGGAIQKNSSNNVEISSEVSEEIVILQGGFKAILETLKISSDKVQLNLMQTICKLLKSEDSKYKLEFRRLEGYKVLGSILKRSRDYKLEQTKQFLKQFVGLWIEIIISDKERQQIVNFDSFETLLKFISAGEQFEVILLLLENLKNLFLANWKNLIIARRLKAAYHLLALAMRLFEGNSDSPANSILSGDTFQQTPENEMKGTEKVETYQHEESILDTLKGVYRPNDPIYYSSDITQRNEQIGQQEREQLLHTISQILIIFSLVEGSFSSELEHAFSEIILKSIEIQQAKNTTVYFLDTLIGFLDRKQTRKCAKIFTFDTSFHQFMDCLKLCLSQSESVHYLGKLLFFGERCLSCDHSNEVQNQQRMKQMERENILIKHIICRNQCEETKNVIEKEIGKLGEREETKILMQMIYLKMKNVHREFGEYNYHVMTVLKDILVNNPSRASLFIQSDGLSILSFISSKILDDNSEFLEKCNLLFIDLCIGKNNSSLLLGNPLLQLNDSSIPTMIEGRRIQCINSIFCSVFNAKLNDSHFIFFELLSRLLLNTDNLKAFKMETNSLAFLMELLGSGKVASSNNNLYTQVLSIFERLIPKLTSSELRYVLDSLLNNHNLKNLGSKKQDTAFFSDGLSILAIHMLLKTNPLLLEKVVGDKYILSLFGFLDSSDSDVKEMALKLILCSICVYSKTKKKESYGKKEQYYYLLGQKLQGGKITQNICKIFYEFTFWEETPGILYPCNSSVVSTLFNRSELAGQIMQKASSEQSKFTKIITNVEMLEIFFKVLKRYEGDDFNQESTFAFRNEMLSVFEAVLDESANLQILLDQPNFLNWLYVMLPNSWRMLEQNLSSSINKYSRGNEERIASNGGSESEGSFHRDSSRENVRIKPNSNIEPNNQFKMQKEKVFGIIQKILSFSFHNRREGDFQDQMRRFIHPDEEVHIIIVRNFLKNLLSNCIVKDDPPQHFLKRLKDLFDNADFLTGFDCETNILILQCIIKMASKNTPQIRQLMKQLKFFEKRDSLIIRILTYELDGDTFLKVFEGIPFEALANLKEFQEKHAFSSIMKILVEKSASFSLQMFIISILKNPSISEKNQKYIAELLGDSKIIKFFYPSFSKQKIGSFAKCLQSNLNNSTGIQNLNSNEEDKGNGGDQDSDEDGQEEEEEVPRRSVNLQKQQMGASFEVDFLHRFYSEESADLRKQIMLRVNVNLMPVLKQYESEEKKLKKKRDDQKQKYVESTEKELQLAQIKVSDLELEINKKLNGSTEDSSKKQKEFQEFVEKRLQEGQILFEKMIIPIQNE